MMKTQGYFQWYKSEIINTKFETNPNDKNTIPLQ